MRKTVGIMLFAAVVVVGCQSSSTERSTAPGAGGTTLTAGTTGEAATGSVQNTPGEEGSRAVATIEGKSGSNLAGTATFTRRGNVVNLVLEVRNGKPGSRAVHLHEVGNCSDPKAESAGGHWNPTDESHGKIGMTEKAHGGDIGNFVIGPDGTGRLEFSTDRWTIGGDAQTNVVGRSIVIHDGEDDYKSQPSGNAGDRIGCGVIEG